MTAFAALLSDRDRQRLADRLTEWRDTDHAMRQRGSLAAPPEPVPLHLTTRGTTAAAPAAGYASRAVWPPSRRPAGQPAATPKE